MRRYINSADALNTLKHLAYETALNQHDPYVADVFEDIAKNRLETWVDLIPTADATKVVRCKDCKHFEYDHWEKVNRVPLIVAHEICTRWGEGCKTSADGYCFLAERKEVEDG